MKKADTEQLHPAIFNSLGSNYTMTFAKSMISSLWVRKRKSDSELLDQVHGVVGKEAVLTYKGREALWLLLQEWGFGPGDIVLTQAFGCFAIEWAIRQTGASPFFVDVAERQTNMSLETLEAAWHDWQSRKPEKGAKVAVIVQHGLGIRVSMAEFKRWCHNHDVLLVEDLAQGFTSQQLKPDWHSEADGVIYSFGQDKIIDIGIGGAYANLLDQPRSTSKRTSLLKVATIERIRASLYPLLTIWLRRSYGSLWHTLLFHLAKRIGLLRSPVKNVDPTPAALPISLLHPLVLQLQTVIENLKHRRSIAEIYHHALSAWQISSTLPMDQASHIRYSIWVDNPAGCIAYMRQHHVFISDRWYRQPSDAGSTGYVSEYLVGSCPQAEELCRHCINLPTHQEVTPNQALKISQLAKAWLVKESMAQAKVSR